MSNSIVNIIGHYQRSIVRSQNGNTNGNGANIGKLLHSIEKLYKLPVTVEHLQETGIGKTVNSLRKYDGEVGVAAKALVAKWKAMVTAEDYAAETAAKNKMETNENEDDDDDDDVIHENTDAGGGDSSGGGGGGGGEDEGQQKEKSSNHHSEYNSKNHSHKSESSNHKDENVKKLKDYSSSKSRHNDKHRSERRSHDKNSSKAAHPENGYSIDTKPLTPKFDEELIKRDNDEDKLVKQNHSSKKLKESSSNTSNHQETDKHQHSSSSTKSHSHNENCSDEKKSLKSSSSSSSNRHKEHSSTEHRNRDYKHHHKSSNSNSNNNNETKEITKDDKRDKNKHKRRHSDSKPCEVSSSSTHPTSNNNKNKVKKIIHDEIDSTTGTSFEDALGMMNPLKLSNNNSNKSSTKYKSPIISSKNSSNSSKSSSLAVAGPSSKSSHSSSSHKHSKSSSSSSSSSNNSNNKSTTNSSSKKVEETLTTPKLLTSSINLKPLDPNIALELPVVSISNNYKPMPLNQTVMECVFGTNQTPSKIKSDSETLQQSMSSKTMRTKVYSGVKTGQILQVPRLFDLCIRFLQKNIDSIEYCGGYPYEVLRHFLERATPMQLMNFEEWNPYIIEDTDELWRQHVFRHYRAEKRKEMETYREMFMRCKDAQETRLNKLAENIKQSQKLVALPIKKTQLAFVDSMVKPPRNIQRKQDQFGTMRKLVATPASRVASLYNLTPNATQTGDSRLKVNTAERDYAQVSASSSISKPKKAPLMAKTLQFMKGRQQFKR